MFKFKITVIFKITAISHFWKARNIIKNANSRTVSLLTRNQSMLLARDHISVVRIDKVQGQKLYKYLCVHRARVSMKKAQSQMQAEALALCSWSVRAFGLVIGQSIDQCDAAITYVHSLEIIVIINIDESKIYFLNYERGRGGREREPRRLKA
jgi:hypothetical protein